MTPWFVATFVKVTPPAPPVIPLDVLLLSVSVLIVNKPLAPELAIAPDPVILVTVPMVFAPVPDKVRAIPVATFVIIPNEGLADEIVRFWPTVSAPPECEKAPATLVVELRLLVDAPESVNAPAYVNPRTAWLAPAELYTTELLPLLTLRTPDPFRVEVPPNVNVVAPIS